MRLACTRELGDGPIFPEAGIRTVKANFLTVYLGRGKKGYRCACKYRATV